jgi:hypothetical protein
MPGSLLEELFWARFTALCKRGFLVIFQTNVLAPMRQNPGTLPNTGVIENLHHHSLMYSMSFVGAQNATLAWSFPRAVEMQDSEIVESLVV